MKKTGICPKCGSKEVYFDIKALKSIDPRSGVFIANRKFGGQFTARVEIYACIDCGYFEEYLSEEDLKDDKIKEKIKAKWNKAPESNG